MTKKLVVSFFWPLLSGFLIGTSYIPFPPYALFFCYVPLWLFALKQTSLWNLIIGAWLCQYVVSLIGFNYMLGAMMEMEFPFYQALFLFLIFCAMANTHIPLSLVIWFFIRKMLLKTNPAGFFLTLFSLPVCLGLSTEYGYMMFDWHLGYMYFYANWPIAQTAEIWGFQFLNTLTLFFNWMFLLIWFNVLSLFLKQKKPHKQPPLPLGLRLLPTFGVGRICLKGLAHWCLHLFCWPLGVGLFCMIGLNGYGKYLKNRLLEPDQKIQVLMIQANIETHKQNDQKSRSLVLSQILKLTSKHFYPKGSLGHIEPSLNLKPDFILWPEGVYPFSINAYLAKKGKDPIQEWISIFNTPLVVSAKGHADTAGTQVQSENSAAPFVPPTRRTNSVFLFDKEGRLIQPPYDKRLLTPIGEYTPGARWFPFIDTWLFGEQSQIFRQGIGTYKTALLGPWRLGFQICYEGLFDFIARDLMREGADLIINVANDVYFGTRQEPYQLAYMTLSRAIETRRPVVRGANSMLSAVVSAKGDILSLKGFGKKSYLTEVPLYSKKNQPSALFMSWGYYINQIFLWVCVLLIMGMNVRHYFTRDSRRAF